MKSTKNLYFKNVLAATLLAATLSSRGQVMSDLLCAYPPSTASAWGGEANTRVNMANGVSMSNALNDQSGTGANFNIVGYIMSANDSSGQDNNYALSLVATDPSFSDVQNYKANVGADQVIFVPYASTGAAGNAYQPGQWAAISSTWWWGVVLAHESGGHNYGRTHNDGMVTPKTIMLHNYCGGGAAPPYFYTDPNIWWNGAQLLSTLDNDCNNGSLPNGGDNSSYSAQWMANQVDHVSIGPALNDVVWRWCFTNTAGPAPAGTTNYDLIANAPAVVRGNGATYTGNALRIPGGTTGNVAMNSMSAYIDLPNGTISSQTNITIEIWATPLSAPNWARIMDFGRCTEAGDGLGAAGEFTGAASDPAPGSTSQSDGIMLTADIGTDLTQQRFEAKHNGATFTFNSSLATTPGVQHHYAITFTDGAGVFSTNGGRWQWYRDGYSVGFMDVSNHLSSIQDVNDWLGRSEWSGDSLANNDYAEVRISNIAMSPRQILANYGLGPNYNPPSNLVTMTNSDGWGSTLTSFNAAGQWSGGSAPASGKIYQTYNYRMLTPATSSGYTFAGSSLSLGGSSPSVTEGGLFWGGTASSTITINSLTVNNARVDNRGSGTFTLAGNMAVTNAALVNAMNGPIRLTANLSGNGSISYVGNQGTQNGLATAYSGNQVTLSGNNSSFTGQTILGFGAGAAGGLTIDSEARLGANPAAFTYNQLAMNRGTLTTTATMTLSNANRGILLDVNGGGFNVSSGTTLTLICPLFSPTIASGATGGNLNKSGAGTLIIASTNSAFNGMLYVDSASSSANDGVLRLVNSAAMASAHSPIYIRNNNSGSSTLQLDGTAGSVSLPQSINLSGRNGSAPAIENIAGTNSIFGGLTLNVGGSSYIAQVDAGVLNLGGTITTTATGTRTLTVQGSGTMNLNGAISDGNGTMSVNKTGAGTLNFASGSTYSGATTVSQGTLALQSAATPVLHLTFNNAPGSGNGSIITNSGSGGAVMNGTLKGNGASIVSGGRFGNALSLNGTGGTAATNIVLINNKCVTTDASGSWTAGYWIKTSTAGAEIMYQGDGTWSSSGQTMFYLNSSNTVSGTRAGAVRWAGGWLTGTAALNNNTWHFITLVDNAGTESIYVDGNLDTVASTMANPLATGANQIWIGGSPDGGDGAARMIGLIDEVWMFNRALSRAEVQSLYVNNVITNAPANTLPPTTPVTVASSGILDLAGVSQTVAGLSGGGLVTNSGAAATLTISNASGSTLFSGAISDASTFNAVNFTKSGSSTVILAGANTYRGTTTVNGGILFVNGSTGSGATTIASSATLGGNGTVPGATAIQSGAILSPGNDSIGALTFGSSLTLAPGSTNIFQISKSLQTNDAANVAVAVNYGGTLIVTNLSGTLSAGDSFKLFNAGIYNGNFSTLVLPPLDANLVWNTSNLASNGTLSVAFATPLQFGAISLNGANLVLNGSGGAANVGYSLIGSTNLALPLTNWSLLGTGAFDASGNFSVTNATTNAPSQFYLLRVP